MKRCLMILIGLIGLMAIAHPAGAQQFSYNYPGSSAAALSTVRIDQNTEILTSAKTLTISDKPVQRLDPGGTDRDVTLPAEASSTNLIFWIFNDADAAGEDLIIKNDTPATIVTLGPGMGMMFTCDGTDWIAIGDNGIVYDAQAGVTTVPTGKSFDVVDVTDTNIPYMQAAGAGFGDSPLSRTDANTILFKSATGQAAKLDISADAGEDNSDKWRIQVADGGDVTLQTYVSGAWVTTATWTNAGGCTVTGEVVDTHYDTIYIPAASMSPTSTSGAVLGSYEYPTNAIQSDYLGFNGATEQYACFSFPMPEGWNLGTITAKFYWSSATGSTAGDTVEWELAAKSLRDGDTIDAAYGTSQVISDILLADNGGAGQLSGASPAITVGGTPALGALIQYKVSRNVAGTDNMTEDAWLRGVRIKFLINTPVVAD